MSAVLVLLVLLAACGENGDGNGDTILTGFSGVLIFGVVAWVVYRYVKGRT